MNIVVKSIGAVVVAGAVALVGAAPASAAWVNHRHYYAHSHYAPVYQQGYYPYYGAGYYPGYYPYYYDPGAAIVGGFVGSIFGAIASQAAHPHYVHRR